MNEKQRLYRKLRITFFILLLFPLLLNFLYPASSSSAKGDDSLVYVVPIEREIERGLQAFLERAFAEAEQAGADHILIEMDTFGGAVDAADGIGQLLQQSTIPVTVFIDGKAISAGAYIALSADQIIMAPGVTMGAATVVDIEGNAGDAKAMSMWIQMMIAAAEQNERNPLYAEAMVNPEVKIEGFSQPLTFRASEALEYGYAEHIASTRAEALAFLGLDKAKLIHVETTFAEKVARFVTHPMIVSILFSLGSLGLILELYSPGFGIPGIIGITSLLLFFFGHMIAGFAGWETLLLFGVGIILILIEIFVPGFGIFGILGLVSLVGSLTLASFDILTGLKALGYAMIITIIGGALMLKFTNKNGVWNKLILEEGLEKEESIERIQRKQELVGKTGVTITKLRPSGIVRINGMKYDVVSDGSLIDMHKPIKVVKAEGTRIVVTEINES